MSHSRISHTGSMLAQDKKVCTNFTPDDFCAACLRFLNLRLEYDDDLHEFYELQQENKIFFCSLRTAQRCFGIIKRYKKIHVNFSIASPGTPDQVKEAVSRFQGLSTMQKMSVLNSNHIFFVPSSVLSQNFEPYIPELITSMLPDTYAIINENPFYNRNGMWELCQPQIEFYEYITGVFDCKYRHKNCDFPTPNFDRSSKPVGKEWILIDQPDSLHFASIADIRAYMHDVAKKEVGYHPKLDKKFTNHVYATATRQYPVMREKDVKTWKHALLWYEHSRLCHEMLRGQALRLGLDCTPPCDWPPDPSEHLLYHIPDSEEIAEEFSQHEQKEEKKIIINCLRQKNHVDKHVYQIAQSTPVEKFEYSLTFEPYPIPPKRTHIEKREPIVMAEEVTCTRNSFPVIHAKKNKPAIVKFESNPIFEYAKLNNMCTPRGSDFWEDRVAGAPHPLFYNYCIERFGEKYGKDYSYFMWFKYGDQVFDHKVVHYKNSFHDFVNKVCKTVQMPKKKHLRRIAFKQPMSTIMSEDENRFSALEEELLDDGTNYQPERRKRFKSKKAIKKKLEKLTQKRKARKEQERIQALYDAPAYAQHVEPFYLVCQSKEVFYDALEPDQKKNLLEKAADFTFQQKKKISEKIEDFYDKTKFICANMTLDDYEHLLEKYKPMNTLNLIAQWWSCESITEDAACVAAFLELHEMYWTTELTKLKVMLTPVIVFCLNVFKGWWKKKDQDLYEFQNFEQSPAHSFIRDTLGFDVPAEILPTAAIVVCVGILLCGGIIPHMFRNFKWILKSLSSITAILKLSSCFESGFSALFDGLSSVIGKLFGYTYIKEEEADVISFKQSLCSFRERLGEMSTALNHNPTSVMDDEEKFNELEALYQELDGVYLRLISIKANLSNCRPLFEDIRQEFKAIQTVVRSARQKTCRKIEPVWIFISGVPGVGKSQLISAIQRGISEKMGRKVTSYARNSGEKHWSGYTGQTFVTYDDFSQSKVDTDHADIMLFKNPNKTTLIMSDNSEKGRQFSSPFVITASNEIDCKNSASVKNGVALNRRRDVLILVSDPELAMFQNQHGCYPYEMLSDDPNLNGNPIITDRFGVTRHFYDPNFANLVINEISTDSTRADYRGKVINVQAVIDKAWRAHLKYKQSYIGSVEVSSQLYEACEASSSDCDVTPVMSEITRSKQQRVRLLPGEVDHRAKKKFEKAQELINYWTPTGDYADLEQNFENFCADMETYQLQSGESFGSYVYGRGKVIAIGGPPGTGKTTILDMVKDHFGELCTRISGVDLLLQKPETPVVIIEDGSTTKEIFNALKQLVVTTYDSLSPIQVLFFSYNKELAKSYCHDEEWTLFYRRLEEIETNFRIKGKGIWSCIRSHLGVGKKNSYENVQLNGTNINEYVGYRFKGVNYTQAAIVTLLTSVEVKEEEFKVAVCHCCPVIPRRLVSATFEVEYRGPFSEFSGGLPSAHFDLSKVSLKKGSLTKALDLIQNFLMPYDSENNKFVTPDTIPEFCVFMNNMNKVCTSELSAHLKFSDGEFYVRTRAMAPYVLRFFKVDDVDFIDGKIVYPDKTESWTKTTASEYAQVFSKEQLQILNCKFKDIKAITDTTASAIGMDTFKDHNPKFYGALRIAAFVAKIAVSAFSIYKLLPMHGRKLFGAMESDTRDRTKIKKSAKQEYTQYFDLNTGEYEWVSDYDSESRPEPKPTPQRIVIDPVLESRPEVKPTPQRVVVDPILLPEASIDQNSRQIAKIVTKNMVQLGTIENGEFEHKVWAMMVIGRCGATVGHVVKDQELYALDSRFDKTQFYPIKILKRSVSHDVTIFQVNDVHCPNFRDIAQYLPSKNELSQTSLYSGSQGILWIKSKINESPTTLQPINVKIDAVVQKRCVSGDDVLTLNGIGYHGFMTAVKVHGADLGTSPGDCGSPLMLLNPLCRFKIMGLHCAANANSGLSNYLVRELFIGMHVEMAGKCQANLPKVYVLSHQEFTPVPPKESLCGMPIVGDLKMQHVPEKSRLWKSPLALPGKNIYEPTILSPIDDRNKTDRHPYYSNLAKWSHDQPNLDEELIDACVEDLAERYAQEIYQTGFPVKKLTKTQAVNSGKEYGVNPIAMSSSPGYPWTCGQASKRKFFSLHVSNDQSHMFYSIADTSEGKRLHNAIDALVTSCAQGKVSAVVFAGHLKDEPVKATKIQECTTRSFAGAPLDYVVAHRQYFAAALGAINSVRHTLPSQIGINPTSMEWHLLVSRLLEHSPIGFDLDFKNFDSTVPSLIMSKIYKIYNRIFEVNDPNVTEVEQIIRKSLHHCLTHPLLACVHPTGTVALQAPGGQVSGQPATSTDNCFVHMIYLMYAWMTIFKDDPLGNFSAFWKNVKPIVYGDDGCYAVDPSVIDRFNLISVSQIMQNIGITCTGASKQGLMQPFKEVKNFEFIKRTFVQAGPYWIGPLHPTSFFKMLNYSKGRTHHWFREPEAIDYNQEDMTNTVTSALEEACFHGERAFNLMKQHLFHKCKMYGIPLHPTLSYTFRDTLARKDLNFLKFIPDSDAPEIWGFVPRQ
ncbi:hypothetical protein 1 [Hubei picorna-like virus 76]|uniref:hypothetical protein 1 n=1 Tax=Hubei picorna-like virus 76 TaxID=1923160 RepID=UPI0009095413|nr:hypothetical protein 1 [Hubei picorna-like virus 76]APG77518.1 hypothetical protein 1 [Hubei picorna-like virus 76]